jgi:predicted metal-dependent enzyme (double-stranded beta helix superfamily)
MNRSSTEALRALIEDLDRAVSLENCAAVATKIKSDLSESILERSLRLPERFRRPRSECYARRLLHRDPDLRFTAVVMTWGPGQGTPLHDHAGIWCVEAVVEGAMEVTQFSLLDDEGSRCRFERASQVRAEVGESGCLIPPFEYHVLRNAHTDRTSITLHVYGGEMSRCCTFKPMADGWHQRREKRLQYHD